MQSEQLNMMRNMSDLLSGCFLKKFSGLLMLIISMVALFASVVNGKLEIFLM